MAFWSSAKICKEAETLINPFNVDAVDNASYELSLGGECFLTSDEDGTKDLLDVGNQISIPPGQFGLLISEESVSVPSTAIAFISIKAGIKFRGLVNVSGFHVDPGFSGKLKFSVYNAGARPVVLERGQKVFLIWYADLDQDNGQVYNGKHQGQSEINSEDVMKIQGKIASPAHLSQRLDEIELWTKITISVLSTIVLGLASTQLKGCFSNGAKVPTPTVIVEDREKPRAAQEQSIPKKTKKDE